MKGLTIKGLTIKGLTIKGLMIVVLAAVALLAVTTSMLRSRSNNSAVATADMPTLQEFQSAASAKAPVEDFEDRSFVYPRDTKR